jgi:hypothetical protein
VILTTQYLADAKNTDSWCARKGHMQCAFPIDVSKLRSSTIVVATNGEHLTMEKHEEHLQIVLQRL